MLANNTDNCTPILCPWQLGKTHEHGAWGKSGWPRMRECGRNFNFGAVSVTLVLEAALSQMGLYGPFSRPGFTFKGAAVTSFYRDIYIYIHMYTTLVALANEVSHD